MPEHHGVDAISETPTSTQTDSAGLHSAEPGAAATASDGAGTTAATAADAAGAAAADEDRPSGSDAAGASDAGAAAGRDAEPDQGAKVSAEPIQEPTGEPRVDAAMEQMHGIDPDSPAEAAVQLAQVYERLQRVLSEP